MITSHSGLIMLNKPSGITSFRVLNSLKNKLSTGKVGHTGTLDKFAEGLMLVLTGKMTKLAPFFSGMDKHYNAVFKFGEETDTLDPEGKVLSTAELPGIELIANKIEIFKGKIQQKPPDFSAVHVNGKRAYKIAAAGEHPDIPERTVNIYDYQIVKWEPPFLSVSVSCSKGTYIRSLARDLGRACESRAHVYELFRDKVGVWDIKDSVKPDNFLPDKDIVSGMDLFKMIPDIHLIKVNESTAGRILSGMACANWVEEPIKIENGITALFDASNSFLALIEKVGSNINYKFVENRSI